MFEISNRLKTRVKGRLLVALLSTQEGKEVRPAKVHQVQCRCLWQLLLLSGASKISIPLARQQAQLNEKVGCDYIKDNRVL